MKTKTLARLMTLTLILAMGLTIISVQNVSAQSNAESALRNNLNTVKGSSGLPGNPNEGSVGISRAIGKIIYVFLGFLAIIFIILIIYAGFLWMTAAGDDSKITKAKGIITSSIIGIIIILSAYIITEFVITNVLTVTDGADG